MLKLYNSLTRKIENFIPLKGKEVGLYACGPTVYNFAHIGNLRTYIFEDILKRTLMFDGYDVKHVMNITDVGHLSDDADTGDDKMEKGAEREHKTVWEIAAFYTEAFKNDLAHLNVLPPSIYCKATDHIAEQIELVRMLETKGFTYKTTDGIYFDTTRLTDYGKLANLKGQSLKAGARVELGEKHNPHDFALWKFSPQNQKRAMEWKSPWGVGFPGWHLECSAMATAYLGQPFDIHCGGIDHIPVHHTNEIAQSEAAAGKPLATYWLHGEFLLVQEEKMAKSGNNFITISTLKNSHKNILGYRYFILQAHYRKQLTFSWTALEAAIIGLEHLYETVWHIKSFTENETTIKKEIISEFSEAINNDLNTPQALAVLHRHLSNFLTSGITYKTILEMDKVLGLGIENGVEEHERKIKDISRDYQKINLPAADYILFEQREKARAARDWAESDRLRQELEKLGYYVEDTKEGTKIHKK